MIALIRPDEVNFPLLLHVLGAMVLIGTLLAAATALLLGWRRDAGPFTRFGFRTLLMGALPAYVLMRVGAQWTEAEETGIDEDSAWIGIGYITADVGALLLLIALIVTGIANRRLRNDPLGPSTLSRVGAVLATLLLVAYVVAVWAMTTKPD